MNLSTSTLSTLMVSLLVVALTGCGKSPEQHLQEGRALMEKNDYSAAILELKSVLQEEPGNRDARLLLGKAHLAKESYADAEKELLKAREQGSSHDEVLPALAKAMLNQGQPQKVVDMELPTTVMSRQALAAVHVMRAEAFISLKREEQARLAIATAEKAEPNQPELLLFKARTAGEQGRLAEAHQLVDAALTGNPKLIEGYYFKASLFQAENKPDQAIQTYEKTLAINPKGYRAYLAIAEAHLRRGQNEAGEKALKAAESIAPGMPMVKYSRALFELRRNNYKAANEAITQVLRDAPDFLPGQLVSAVANHALGNVEQSLKSAQLVLAKQPDNPLAARVVAASQVKTGNAKDALNTLTPLLKTRPNDDQLLSLASDAYFLDKDFPRALSLLKRAEAASPDNTVLKTKQAVSLLALGQTDQALAEFEQAAKLSQDASRADLALITIHLQRKEFDQALEAINALEKKIPGKAFTHNARGITLLGKKDYAAARQALEKAVSLDATFFPAVANLARLDLSEKKPDAAKKRFENLLAKEPNNLQAMLAMAEIASFNKQDKDYLAWLEKAARAHPTVFQPWSLLSQYHLNKNEGAKALAFAKEALRNNPDAPQAINLLGATQMATKDINSGIETYKQLVQKTPNSADAHRRLGLAQATAGNVAEARSNLNLALKMQPDYVDAMQALLNLEMSQKNPDGALQWARKIQSVQPKSPIGHRVEGDILMTQEQFAPAAKAYQLALDKGAGTQGVIKLHAALVRAGDAKGAQSRIDAWVKAHPSDLVTRMYLAEQSMQAGVDKVAVTQYEEILRQRPGEAMALNSLAYLYQKQKDPRALGLAEKAYLVLPTDAAIQDTLGWLLVEQGQTKRGLELLAKSASQLANSPTVQYHYAVALARTGNKMKAKQILQATLAGKAKFPDAEAAKVLLESLK